MQIELEYVNFKEEDKEKYMEIPHNVTGPAYLWRMNKPEPLNETRLGVCMCFFSFFLSVCVLFVCIFFVCVCYVFVHVYLWRMNTLGPLNVRLLEGTHST